MISLPALFSWETRLLFPNGTNEKVIFMAATMERAHEMATELYPEASVRIMGILPEWDDAA